MTPLHGVGCGFESLSAHLLYVALTYNPNRLKMDYMKPSIKFFLNVAQHPMETIESVVAFVLSITGLWLLSPWFEPATSTTAEITDGSHIIPYVFGCIEILLALPLIYSLINRRWSYGLRVRKTISFLCFVLFVFYGMSGILLNHLHRISWVSAFGFAAIAAVAHLRLQLDLIEESERAVEENAGN